MTSCKLGSGASGKVYMAINRRFRKQVACKIIRICSTAEMSLDVKKNGLGFASNLDTSTIVRDFDTKAAKNTMREIEILEGLRHVGIVPVNEEADLASRTS